MDSLCGVPFEGFFMWGCPLYKDSLYGEPIYVCVYIYIYICVGAPYVNTLYVAR